MTVISPGNRAGFGRYHCLDCKSSASSSLSPSPCRIKIIYGVRGVGLQSCFHPVTIRITSLLGCNLSVLYSSEERRASLNLKPLASVARKSDNDDSVGVDCRPFWRRLANSLLHFVQESGLPHVPVMNRSQQVTSPLLVASRHDRLLRR